MEGYGGIYLVQDEYEWQALVNTVLNCLIPLIVEDLFTICATISFSVQIPFH